MGKIRLSKTQKEIIQEMTKQDSKERIEVKINSGAKSLWGDWLDKIVEDIPKIKSIIKEILEGGNYYSQSEVDAMMEDTWNAARKGGVYFHSAKTGNPTGTQNYQYSTFKDYRKSLPKNNPPQEQMKEEPITIPITLFTQYDKDEKLWYVHSSFDIVNGTGQTEDEAISNHLDIMNAKMSSERYEDLMKRNPNMKIKKYLLIAS